MLENKKIEFDRISWLELRENRFLMVRELINNGALFELLLYRNKEEIIDLLGCEFNDNFSDIWTYYLGKKYFFIFSRKRKLYLHFNKNGRVNVLKYK